MRYALLLACATLSAQSYSIQKEQALGAQLAAEYRHQGHILDVPSVNAYLDELGQRLAAQAPATGFTYTFELADDDQTWIHEAAAFPGGPVFVPATLILAATDEDELAAMLAHAIAHIATWRQTSRVVPKGQVVNYASIPLVFMGGWAGLTPGNNSAAIPTGMREAQRRNELAADQLASRILSATAYRPQALARYIARMQPAAAPAFYPDKDQRLAALDAAIRELPPAVDPAHPAPAHPGFDAIHETVTRLMARPPKRPPTLLRSLGR